jgi:hypothetical protein
MKPLLSRCGFFLLVSLPNYCTKARLLYFTVSIDKLTNNDNV